MLDTRDYEKTYISSNTSTQVFIGKGTLRAIVVGTTAAGAIGIIDGIGGTTVNVGELKSSIVEGTYEFNVSMGLGCRIVTASSPKITIVWEQ